jgi:hypothetical protein
VKTEVLNHSASSALWDRPPGNIVGGWNLSGMFMYGGGLPLASMLAGPPWLPLGAHQAGRLHVGSGSPSARCMT